MKSRIAIDSGDDAPSDGFSRRELLGSLLALGVAPFLGPPEARAQSPSALLTRRIPSSGEALPLVGLGSWITFNVGNDQGLRDECTEVMGAFFESGGRLIDSSPMYGSSQSVIGRGLAKLKRTSQLFAADKVWTADGGRGAAQIEESRRNWGVSRFDLVQVHNLLAWERHLPTLFAMKSAGRIRYVGITTSEGRRHDLFEKIMRSQPLDFIQLSYNPIDREAERRLLPLAKDRGMAVLVNRPFQQGRLTRHLARHPLPGWAAETGARTWAQLILKFIASHPAVTCAIPATTIPAHARENMGAARGVLPGEAIRQRIADTIGRI
ncbi:MAG TPA: aldo/keto reductase [Thermoanaerobaculia bacterium]|nr:aldo/keto reductase [Thermoanaerobaculia bacterium]